MLDSHHGTDMEQRTDQAYADGIWLESEGSGGQARRDGRSHFDDRVRIAVAVERAYQENGETVQGSLKHSFSQIRRDSA